MQSVRSGKHRAGFIEHRSTHDVPSFATEFCSVQIEDVQLPAMVGMIGPNRLGSVPRGRTYSVGFNGNRTRTRFGSG